MNSLKHLLDALNLEDTEVMMYGHDKAKISLDVLNREDKGKVILMTAINPTPFGEGKTTMNIGLSMALNALEYSAISALREPSMGPVFGMKGGATGGGKAQVIPKADIDLHFTGDMHAITACHNLLTALLENHIYHGNELGIDPDRILWNRVLDVNDRSLRRIEVAGHKSSFDITAASEIMAILCLANDLEDLRNRLSNILVAYTVDGKEVSAKDLNAVGSMMLVLKDAIKPNLVSTLEATPAILHGGPFANIAHGCNSIIATKMATKLSDYVVTEAGFGADLGAEKFFDIKCRLGEINPSATVIVATVRALKYNGGVGVKEIANENLEALKIGSQNLVQHVENMKKFKVPVVVAINRFDTDTDAEIAYLESLSEVLGVDVIPCEVFSKGGQGAIELAHKVVEICNTPSKLEYLYQNTTIEAAIKTVATEIYRADNVVYSDEAKEQLKELEARFPEGLPVCIAKTQYSFSDDAKKLNAPRDFEVTVRQLKLAAGAGFVVALLGNVMRMPGLPKVPNANHLDYDGQVIGM